MREVSREDRLWRIRGTLTDSEDIKALESAIADAGRWDHIRRDGLIWRATFLVSDPMNTEVYYGAKADAVVDAAMRQEGGTP